MKKIINVVCAFICFLAISPFICYAERSNNEIYDITRDTRDTTYDIWNYLNNEIYPKIQSQNGSLSQEDINTIKSQMNTVETKVNNINVQKDIENYYDSLPEDDGTANGQILSFGQCILETTEMYWNSIGEAIVKSNEGEYNIPMLTFHGIKHVKKTLKPQEYFTSSTKNTAYNIFRSLGYSLVLLFFSLSLIENTIKLDAFSLKGGAVMFGRLAVSKIVIDMAGKVCMAILDVCATTCSKLLSASATQLDLSGSLTDLFKKSDVKFVGGIIDVFTALGIIIPILIITIPIMTCSIMIIIKLITRGLELTMLIIVSPTFLACYSSDVTKQYTKTFIVTFLQVALQVVFMMVVFFIGSGWLSASMRLKDNDSTLGWMLAMIPNMLFIIVITKMIVKPPKVLTHLLH